MMHLIYFRCSHWDEMSPVFSSAAKSISENSVISIFTADTLVLCSSLNKKHERTSHYLVDHVSAHFTTLLVFALQIYLLQS